MSTDRTVRWGVLSTARIGLQKVIPAIRAGRLGEVRAIASRDLGRARAAADTLGIPTAHGSYEALFADPDVDAIYNALPNHLHVPTTLAAAQAGKHVLCEKPMALTAAELDVLRPFADRVHLREAFMVRHHPQWHAVREAVRRGEIGDLRYLQAPFSYFNDDAGNIRNRLDVGGGALHDIGCYIVCAARWFFEAEPVRAMALIDRDPRFGTDRAASGVLDFGAGRQASFTVGTQAARHQRLTLVGTKARLELDIPFNPLPGSSTRWRFDDCSALDGSGAAVHELPACDMYALQMDAFAHDVLHTAPSRAGLDEAQAVLRVLDAFFASERSGRFETV